MTTHLARGRTTGRGLPIARRRRDEREPAGRAARRGDRRTTRRVRGRSTAESTMLLGLIVTLNLTGLVMVMSASSVVSLESYDTSWYYFERQAIWAGIGTVAMLVIQRIDYHRWRRWSAPALVGSVVLLVAVLVPGVGVNVNGATRWLGYGPVVIQPSELAKLALLLSCAALLAKRIDEIHRADLVLWPVGMMTAVVIGLVMLQPNLGTSIVLGAIVMTLLFVAGMPGRTLAAVVGVLTSLAVFAALAAPYRRARVLSFLHPEADPQGNGYQTIQAWMAMAEGGMSGVGIGASRAKWGFLPFAHTDFIFAIIAEEFGFLGAALVVLLFVGLGLIGIRTAVRAPDPFGMLLAAGVTAWFVFQAVVNIGAVVGALPITGVPLPFVSSGGSSLVTSMAGCGVLLNVARQARTRTGRRPQSPTTRDGRNRPDGEPARPARPARRPVGV